MITKHTPLYLFTACFLLLTTNACHYFKLPNTAENSASEYFGLQSYFKNEVNILQNMYNRCSKTVFLNSQRQNREVHNIKWERELALFTDTDLNKPAWRGLFEVSTQANDSIKIVNYKATNKNIPLQLVTLSYYKSFSEEKPLMVYIKNHTHNPIYETTEYLYYNAKKGYTIENQQDVLFVGKNTYKIEGNFLKN